MDESIKEKIDVIRGRLNDMVQYRKSLVKKMTVYSVERIILDARIDSLEWVLAILGGE
jgi:hypothetical protein